MMILTAKNNGNNHQGAVAANEYMESRNEKGDAARMQVDANDHHRNGIDRNIKNRGQKCTIHFYHCCIGQEYML